MDCWPGADHPRSVHPELMAFFCLRCKSDIDPNYRACPSCGEPVTDFVRQHHDKPVDGKYRIISCLGVGGMGEVYKVEHIHLGAIRVIKLMRSTVANDQDAHNRFLREARLATQIQHPSVATLFDFSTLPDGSRFMVWEYIEGQNLHEVIKQYGPLSPRHAARLGHDVLLGLEAIHKAGIVHRDISPENIMITPGVDGERVKIIDLGIAKQSGEDAHKTMTGVFVGKWKYCSPEHLGILSEGEIIDARADLYSFGVVLYEALTGVAPFQSNTPHGFLMAHVNQAPPSLRETNPGVSASPILEGVIFKALEKNRDNRFATAREFAAALQPLRTAEAESVPGSPFNVPGTADASATSATVPARTSPVKARTHPMTSRELVRPGQVPTAEPPHDATVIAAPEGPKTSSARMGLVIVASAALAIVLILAGQQVHSVISRVPGSETRPIEPATSVVKTGHLGLNAFPWAEISRIHNRSTGADVEMTEPVITPAVLSLEPASYEVYFSNPAFSDAIIRVVELKSGEHQVVSAQFVAPEDATLPLFSEKAR